SGFLPGGKDPFVPFLSGCAHSFGNGNHDPASSGEPLRCSAGETGDGFQPLEPDAGLQLSRYYDLSLDWGTSDSPDNGNSDETECRAGSKRGDSSLDRKSTRLNSSHQ